MLWHIGNTTVRTPYRLREALRVLEGSPLNGNISGNSQENDFAELLHMNGVLVAPRVEKGLDASDLGRKWRAALSQLGFITPQLSKKTKSGYFDPALSDATADIEELSGRPYEITPNGYRLGQAEIITAQQECFLRVLASYRIPSVLETRYKTESFSPLRFVLHIMHELEKAGHQSRLSFTEFALFVQTASPAEGVETVCKLIMEFRASREKAGGRVRAFERNHYQATARRVDREVDTLDDYADVSFRYLKATGLFRSAGRGIVVSPARAQLASLLREEDEATLTNIEYLHSLWFGAKLPTDDAESALTVVNDLVNQLQKRGVTLDPTPAEIPLPDLETRRHTLEALISELDEVQYADQQAEQVDEIIAWLQAIPTRGSAKLPSGETVSIPKGEGPAYLEWAIWRAFLAIDSLINRPWEARRFQIDQDFLPVNCAPGGGPDMVFEFEDAIIVVEVTLTSSSRQEAAEGEPVRRHVAAYLENSSKPVFGLFIAVSVDNNTAHTFRLGDWYLADDTKLNLDIVPISLTDFLLFFELCQTNRILMPRILRQILIECRAAANQDAPAWKIANTAVIERLVARYSNVVRENEAAYLP